MIDLRQQFQLEEQRLQRFKDLLDPIKSDTSDRARCLPNTRTGYLRDIEEWLFSPPKENILWLNGIAGSGKSTIAASITDLCDDKSRLAAFLFFEREKNEYKSIIRTIAYQLAAFEPILAAYIVPVAEQLKNITGSETRRQFEKLLLEPLKSAKGAVRGPIVVILDALDECGTTEQRREILELLKVDFAKLPLELRFFVTSRPENDIMHSLSSQKHILEVRLEHTAIESRNDVLAYIQNMMHKAIKDPIPDGFAWTDAMTMLSDAADGLFIWATTAVMMVMNSDDPFEELEGLVSNVRLLNGLDNLYATVLEQSGISWQSPKSVERFRNILGLILFGKEPLSGDNIDSILGLGKGKARLTLQRLRSVLAYEYGQSIRLYHASFADYLLSYERSGNHPWYIDTNSQRRTITVRCFDIMEQLLRFNVCDLETSFLKNDDVPGIEGRITTYIPTHLTYACRFWSGHLCDVSNSEDMADRLEKYAYNHLPYWLEVLSLTKHFTRLAGRALLDAVLWSAVCSDETGISSFLWDAYKLVIIFSSPIAQSAPHIYLSMLSLANDESVVAKHYCQTHPTIHVTRFGTKPPNPCIKVLIRSGLFDSSVTFSPDGRYVCGSYEHTIRIWHLESSEVVTAPFHRHSYHVGPVAFSPNGKHVVSGATDGSVIIWDAESGRIVTHPSGSHKRAVSSVAFSLCGKYVFTGSSDPITPIRIWDVESEAVVPSPIDVHGDGFALVAFSPDGEHIATVSNDWTIRIWDIRSGEVVVGPFEGHNGYVQSLVFLPKGDYIASGCHDNTICIWNAQTGRVVTGPFKGYKFIGTSVTVVFSFNGKRIVSNSKDRTIRIWDIESGECLTGPFRAGNVDSVAFLPDRKRVASSSSSDGTIRIWDAEFGKILTGLSEQCEQEIVSAALSPDGGRVAVGYRDGKILIWDSNYGKVVARPFELYGGRSNWITFTPDRKHIVSWSRNKYLRFLDTESSEVSVEPFEIVAGLYSNNKANLVAFLPDGGFFVSGSTHGENIMIWDTKYGKAVAGPYRGHKRSTMSVVFLPDKKHIASVSGDGTLQVWNIKSCNVVARQLEGYTEKDAYSATFLLDRRHIAFGFSRAVRIWDVQSGKAVTGLFEVDKPTVGFLNFSANGEHLLCRSVAYTGDDIIWVWNAKRGEDVSSLLVRKYMADSCILSIRLN
ncbi:WD40 repeat-like protein [Fomitiporia mediterranea MF3/22]|uniref:WD40 repeat-like protein n=1 Tax=Fomitiporia mediterranea (strain MF3/22) TaxID=694068 RepID=UPI00044082BE|nr:WD40 repeat-like protein [Fomitiporia mediterranea MF3/22]EJC99151.1 WD40 repeat-like protein [Fomitiporia mediterranea MF3/22]